MARDLYTFFRSSTSFRLRIALAYKGLDYEPHFVSLPKMQHHEAGYSALNPQRLVPMLVDGERRLIQTLSIIEYLEEAYPEPPLLPKDIDGRAYVRALSQIVSCEIHPLNNVRVLKHLKVQFAADEAATNRWYAHWIAEGLRGYEDYLVASGRFGQFCNGDTVSMADVCLVPQIFNAQRFNCPLDAYPATMRIFARCMQEPAFVVAQPKTQADAF